MDGDLPTSTTVDGFEATVIAGVPNPYFNLEKAMTCSIQRAYMANAFGQLTEEDQWAFINENNLIDLAVIAMLMEHDSNSMIGMLYTMLGYADNGMYEFIRMVIVRIDK